MANIVPAASSGFETAGSVGNWVVWFSATLTQTTTQALVDTGSMQVTADAGIWGLQLSNWPGWAAGVQANHQYEIKFSVRKTGGPSRTVTLHYEWRDEGGTVLLESDINIATSANTWVTSAVTPVTSPTGATRLWLEIDSSNSATGDVFHVDEIIVDDAPGGGAVSGSGTVTAPAAQVNGSSTATVAGSGASAAPAAQLAGTGGVTVSGAGALTSSPAVLDGSGSIGNPAITGSGTATAPAASLGGAGSVAVAGTGGVTAPAADVSGTGNIGNPVITGNGALTAPVAAVAGAGSVVVSGTGALTPPAAGISAAGTVTIDGNGTLVTPTAIVDGSGAVVITGNGSVIAPAAVLSGSEDPPQVPVTPASRTFTITAEKRELAVTAEDRTLVVPAESRAQ